MNIVVLYAENDKEYDKKIFDVERLIVQRMKG